MAFHPSPSVVQLQLVLLMARKKSGWRKKENKNDYSKKKINKVKFKKEECLSISMTKPKDLKFIYVLKFLYF